MTKVQPVDKKGKIYISAVYIFFPDWFVVQQ